MAARKFKFRILTPKAFLKVYFDRFAYDSFNTANASSIGLTATLETEWPFVV